MVTWGHKKNPRRYNVARGKMVVDGNDPIVWPIEHYVIRMKFNCFGTPRIRQNLGKGDPRTECFPINQWWQKKKLFPLKIPIVCSIGTDTSVFYCAPSNGIIMRTIFDTFVFEIKLFKVHLEWHCSQRTILQSKIQPLGVQIRLWFNGNICLKSNIKMTGACNLYMHKSIPFFIRDIFLL